MIERLRFLPLGYILTVLVEMPVLLLGLSKRHGVWRRIAACFWLNACSYPVVVLVLPGLIWSRLAYLSVALCECALFTMAYRERRDWSDRSLWRDWAAIVTANLCSFAFGEWLFR